MIYVRPFNSCRLFQEVNEVVEGEAGTTFVGSKESCRVEGIFDNFDIIPFLFYLSLDLFLL